MTVIKRILLTVFLAVTGLSLSAQEKPDSTAYRFRFVAENDMFFSPWSGNGQELERLLAAIDEHRPAIEAGQMYLLVTSYATDGNEEQTAAQVAKTRRNRVKSELIVRGKIKSRTSSPTSCLTKPIRTGTENPCTTWSSSPSLPLLRKWRR